MLPVLYSVGHRITCFVVIAQSRLLRVPDGLAPLRDIATAEGQRGCPQWMMRVHQSTRIAGC
jgi:hypothetical protein